MILSQITQPTELFRGFFVLLNFFVHRIWRTAPDLRQPRRFFGHRTRKIAFTMPSLLVWMDMREVFAFSPASNRRKCAFASNFVPRKSERFFGRRTRKIAWFEPAFTSELALRSARSRAISAASNRRNRAGSFTRNKCARRNPPVKVSLIEGVCDFFDVRQKN